MPRGCDHAVHVEVYDPRTTRKRYFIVEFNSDCEVLRIKERKPKEKPQLGVYYAAWWVASSHALGTGDTLPKRVISAARQKLAAEERAANATP